MTAATFEHFSVVRKGYDPDQVRATIAQFAVGMRQLHEENDSLRAHLSAMPMVNASGSDAAAVIEAAHREADEIRARARRDAADFIHRANQHAEQLERQLAAHISAATAESA